MDTGPIAECERCRDRRHLTKHRKVPGCRGGTYAPANVMMVCRPCHDILDHELGLSKSSGRTGRYVACERCGDVTERITAGFCRDCLKAANRSKLGRFLEPVSGMSSLGEIARWK